MLQFNCLFLNKSDCFVDSFYNGLVNQIKAFPISIEFRSQTGNKMNQCLNERKKNWQCFLTVYFENLACSNMLYRI